MPNNRVDAARSPALVICLAVLAVLAVLGVTAAVILTALDANASPDLPDPLVNNVGDFAASSSVIAMILLGIHILRRTSTDNTRAGVAAIADARRDLKDDTGEIPGLARLMRQPEIIIVERPIRRVEQVDRERARRILDETEARLTREATEQAELEYAQRYREMTQPEVPQRPRLVPDVS